MHTSRHGLVAALLFALVCVPAVRAQQQPSPQAPAQPQDQSSAPIPAYHSPLASLADNPDAQNADDSQRLVPDDHALAGAESLSLGSPEISRSYWQPHVDVNGTAYSNALGQN